MGSVSLVTRALRNSRPPDDAKLPTSRYPEMPIAADAVDRIEATTVLLLIVNRGLALLGLVFRAFA